MKTLRFEDKPFYHFFTTVSLVEEEYIIYFKQQYCYEQDLQNTKILHTLKYPKNTSLETIYEEYIQVKGYHGGGEWVFKISPENKYKHHTSYWVQGLRDFKKKFKLCVKVGRAFDIDKRIGTRGSGLLKQSGRTRDQLEILTVLTGTHQEIYNLEQEMHEELRERGFAYTDETWSTELFTSDSRDMILRLCDQSGLPEGEW